MRRLILLSVVVAGVSWGTGNTCTLASNTGAACSSKTCTASGILSDTTHANFTGTGCTGVHYTISADNLVVPSGFAFTDDVGWTYGNYNGPVYSYISSLTVAPGSTTGCSGASASIGNTNVLNGYGYVAPSLTVSGGVVTAASLNFERPWYTAGAASPPVTLTGCSYTGSYTSTTSITPVWAQGGAKPALEISGGTTSFTLASAAAFRGDIEYNPTANGTLSFILNAGASLTWDSSGTTTFSDGAHTIYGFVENESSGYTTDVFAANGTSASHATITSNTGGANSVFLAQRGCNIATTTSITMSYTDLSNLGGLIDPIFDGNLQNNCGPAATWNVTHSTFNGVGLAAIYQNAGTQTLMHQYNVHTNQLGVADMALFGTSTLSTGSRNISNNVFGSQFGCLVSGSINSASTMQGTTLSGNYFGDSTCPINYTASTLAGSLSYNLLRNFASLAPVGYSALSYTGNYWLFAGPMFNPHLLANGGPTGSPVWSGNVIDMQEDITPSGDATGFLGTPPASGPYTVTLANSIFLRTKQGHGQGWLALSDTAIFGTNRPLAANHNVHWGRNISGAAPGGNYGGLILVDHGGTTSQAVSSLKSNIEVGLGGSYNDFKLSSVQFNSATTAATADMCTPSTCDYNAGYLLTYTNNCGGTQSTTCPNAGRGYDSKFTTTPGPHDIDVVLGLTGSGGINPQFADPDRNLATWDTAYLHHTASRGAWSGSGVSYTVGQTASSSQAGVYGGAPINYRVTAAHTSSAINQPDLTLTSANGHIASLIVSSSTVETWTTDLPHGLLVGQLVYVWGPAGDNTPLKTVTAVTTYTFTTANQGYTCSYPCTITTGLSAQIWRNSWEYASEYDLRTAIPAGTIYTDGSINCVACVPVQALVNWITTGHIVMNPALWLAGHDGQDVGAASLAPAQHIRFVRRVP